MCAMEQFAKFVQDVEGRPGYQRPAAFAVGIATLGTFTFRLVILLSTVGFVAYGLYLLRNTRVRANGDLTKPAPSRVR